MKFRIIFFALLFTTSLLPQKVVDKIVAIVDNEIILQSEVDFQANLLATQRKLDPNDPELRKRVLNSMINDKLVYAQADIDSIKISENEIKQRIDYQINVFTQQYGSIAKVEQVYGMSLSKIKRELRDDVKKNLMIQKIQQKKFSDVKATRREIESFYYQFKDSLGIIPEKVHIAHIFRKPEASKKTIKKYYDFAQAIRDSILNGADFTTMAKKYSEDPGSAAKGGDLGFVKKGVFYPEFEAAAFALKVGEISPIIETPAGFHIIQLLEKRGDKIHTRHILVSLKPTKEDEVAAANKIKEIYNELENGADFVKMVEKYSQDESTNKQQGHLGRFGIDQLRQTAKEFVFALKGVKVGGYSAPIKTKYGFHILKLNSRELPRELSLKKDWDNKLDARWDNV